MALDNLQQLTIAMDFDDASTRLNIKTLTSTIADIERHLHADAVAGRHEVAVHLQGEADRQGRAADLEDVQRSAIKESFVNQVRAIKKQAASADPLRRSPDCRRPSPGRASGTALSHFSSIIAA